MSIYIWEEYKQFFKFIKRSNIFGYEGVKLIIIKISFFNNELINIIKLKKKKTVHLNWIVYQENLEYFLQIYYD